MKTIYKIVALILFSASFTVAQNIEFEKANFADKKDFQNNNSLTKRIISVLE